ncbi:MAG: hypothetical protein J7623_14820 [Chitinophaga sp.]|uniref:DUF5691 domain-containing protein n=1 Tax=Chitinophaga sp. TaxID=1869181 RepID=UPI001B215D0E|nr:DUF5691 domain-containing protein [Chitinophaga sp.]MBO9729908.1 hypothetical protein [Chitinophaga sp.]
MERWNQIINTALLGTAKKQADAQGLQGPLQAAAATILGNAGTDREEQFLQLAAVVYNYRQSGIQPVTTTVPPLPVCPAETKAYCPPAAIRALQPVLETDSIQLLQLWLEHCTQRHFILPPAQLPVMLDKAWRNKSLRALTAAAGGYRAEWLGQFNPDWNFSRVAETLEERWENGATAQRVEALQELRATDPVMALTWLQQSWAKESATVKAELLAVLEQPPQESDLEWLESLLTEKSKTVKEIVVRLLKKLPGSSIHELYWQVLAGAVQPQWDGHIVVALPELTDERIFQSGIEKLSNSKSVADETHILYQLISAVHPARWETHFGRTPAEVIRLFLQYETLQPFVPALVQAITWFEAKEWATTFMEHSETFYIDILPMLPTTQQQQLSEHHFVEHPEAIIKYAGQNPAEWSVALCTRILRYAASQPYTYNQLYMNNVIRQIPVAIAATLDNIVPTESYHVGYWNNIKVHLGKLIQAKSLLPGCFNQ